MPIHPRWIIGLGNPGFEYQETPHNLGRYFVEWVSQKKKLDWKKTKHFYWTDSNPGWVYLNTYMNLSGEAVRSLVQKFNPSNEELLICYDDFDLPLGRIRIRPQGSAGTHNGLKSILQHLQTQEVPRMRLGVGPLPLGADPANYVLKPFFKKNKGQIERVLEVAQQAVESMSLNGIAFAMNQFNAVQS